MKLIRKWGFEKISLSPVYFNFSRLKYALIALAHVKGKVLEVGGGAGAFTRAIYDNRTDLNIICTDYDSNLIASAKGIDKNNTYLVANVEKLPFPNKSFNAVMSFDVIEHINSPRSAFSEIYRVLNSGGITHNAIPLEGGLFTIHGLMNKIGVTPKEKYAGHINQFSKDDIVLMLKKTGFKNIKYKYSGHFVAQLTDFIYFISLSVLGKKPNETVEGLIEELPKGVKKWSLTGLRVVLSFIFFIESFILQDFPGQIGHFTATK